MHSAIVKTKTAEAVEGLKITSGSIAVKLGIEPGEIFEQRHTDTGHRQLYALEMLAEFLQRVDEQLSTQTNDKNMETK